jgi:hypothetical protein
MKREHPQRALRNDAGQFGQRDKHSLTVGQDCHLRVDTVGVWKFTALPGYAAAG